MEHLQHFGLAIDPFQIEPDLRFYYDSAVHTDAQRRIERGVRQAKGLSILTGEGGTGKSLLARRMLGGLAEEMFPVSVQVLASWDTARGFCETDSDGFASALAAERVGAGSVLFLRVLNMVLPFGDWSYLEEYDEPPRISHPRPRR